MRMYDLITKKKHGEALTADEITEMIHGYTCSNIPDYQMSAMLMAIYFRGFTDEETAALTAAIAKSGDTVDLSEFGTLSVDKHSTGGVGDKTTLIVAPLAAALGCTVAKMSGRGLGHTGGTVDKLESFPGYNTSLPPDEFLALVRKHGLCVIGQSGNLAPADKKLYALRDVTATVDSIPLIASSIMGKKLAAGAHSIVLDVKYGSGAFTKTKEAAEELAEKMVTIGRLNGRRTAAIITNMEAPLGYAIGNILEAREAISVLRGEGPDDLTEICIELAAAMAQLALGIPQDEARHRARCALTDGSALLKFREWISAQGGDTGPIDDFSLFKKPKFALSLCAPRDGYVYRMDAERIGLAAVILGAGRKTKEDAIDHSAGIVLKKKPGKLVHCGDELCVMYSDSEENFAEAEQMLLSAIEWSDIKPVAQKLIHKTVT